MAACGCLPVGPQLAHHPVPQEDGESVILYDVHIVEDDRDCGARIPIKESDETLLVQWWTDREITLYARGGIYQVDVTLDERGEYQYDGTQGPCLPGSWVWGRLDRQRGESRLLCHKRDCDVPIQSYATRRVPDGGP